MPEYQLAPLMAHLGALEARQQFCLAQAALVPYLGRHDRETYFDTLRDQMESLYPRPKAEPMPKDGQRDPKAAADYFRAMGVNVVESA